MHRKADEGGIPGRMSTEENAARSVPGRREPWKDLGDTALDRLTASLAGERVPQPPEDAAAVLLHRDLGPGLVAELG